MTDTRSDVEFYGDQEYPAAIVIRQKAKIEGIEFFSPESYSQQIGLMTRPKDYRVLPHIHNQVTRRIEQTQEVLVLRSGVCQINLYGANGAISDEIKLSTGDVILLAHGGHEIIMLSECELLEIKQGPYAGPQDKQQLQV
jgi:hypothetical protein